MPRLTMCGRKEWKKVPTASKHWMPLIFCHFDGIIQVSMSANCDLLSRRGCSQKTMQTLLSDSSTIVPHPKSSSMKLRGSSRLIKAHMMSSSKIQGHLWSRPLAASLLSQLTSCSARHAHARIRSHHYKEHQIMHACVYVYVNVYVYVSVCV